jgi:hypothetical protein
VKFEERSWLATARTMKLDERFLIAMDFTVKLLGKLMVALL